MWPFMSQDETAFIQQLGLGTWLWGACHDSLISVDNYLIFSLYLPLLHSLILQARHFVIHISSWAQPLLVLAIGPSLYPHYLL